MNRFVTLAAAAAGLTLLAGAASAQDVPVSTNVTNDPAIVTRHTTVDLAGVDVMSGGGARIALDRIDRAATAVCGGAPKADAWADEVASFSACHSEAVNNAVRDVQGSVLTALMKGKGPTLMARN